MKSTTLISKLNKIFPKDISYDWDNVGKQNKIKDRSVEINNAIVTLDVTNDVVDFAIAKKANLIFSHHPLYIDKEQLKSKYFVNLINKLYKKNIIVYSAHTNFDLMEGGMNDILASMIPSKKIEKFSHEFNNLYLGRIITLDKEYTSTQFANILKKSFELKEIETLKLINKIKKVAIIGGSGQKYIDAALKNKCDALITGDITHHSWVYASECNINLFNITHAAEWYGIKYFKSILEEQDIKVFVHKKRNWEIKK